MNFWSIRASAEDPHLIIAEANTWYTARAIFRMLYTDGSIDPSSQNISRLEGPPSGLPIYYLDDTQQLAFRKSPKHGKIRPLAAEAKPKRKKRA